MSKLLTSEYRVDIAATFVNTFANTAVATHYMFVGRSLPWDDDGDPPSPNTSVTSRHYQTWREMVHGKLIGPDDVSVMIANYTWQTGTVYDMYDDQDADLESKQFFVISEQSGDYSVFKCLNNNGGAQSTDQPLLSETSADDVFYQTADGYQWKLMLTIPAATYAKFATADYVPLVTDANVSGNAAFGTVETYLITAAGQQYNSYANGTISQAAVAGNTLIHSLQSDTVTLSSNTDFYKDSTIYIRSGTGAGQARTISEYIVTGSDKRVLIDSAFTTLPDNTSVFEIAPRVAITGDGSGAIAICTVNSSANSISSIEVIDRGTGYTYAAVTVTGNTGLVDGNGSMIAVSSATIRPIISPPDGHGSHPDTELYAATAAVTATFSNTESGTISTDNDFRTLGVIKNPRFANTVLTVDDSSGFADGQTVTQQTTAATGTVTAVDVDGSDMIRLTDVWGIFETGYEVVASNSSNASIATSNTSAIDRSFTTFDQRDTFTVTILDSGDGGFQEDEQVFQSSSQANGYIHAANSSVIHLVDPRGTFALSDDPSGLVESFYGGTSGAVAKLETHLAGDLTPRYGQFLYNETFQPVSRSNTQSENVKLIIEF